MPYDVRAVGDLFKLRFHGTIDSEDLQKSLEEIEGIEAVYEITPDRITDLSESDAASWSFFVIEELAQRRRTAQLKNMVKSAIYAPTDLHYGYSRMFQMLNDNPQIDVEVFRDLAAAETWLASDTRHRQKI